MRRVGAALRLNSTGGTKTDGAGGRRRTAIGRAIAVLLVSLLATLLAACQTYPPRAPSPSRAALAAAFRSSADAGLDLYESGEFPLAARHFADAAGQARRLGDPELEKQSVASECMAWLHARQLSGLAECSQRLEALQRHTRQSDPGLNTLIAFGAIAGHRPLPPLRLPNTVRSLVQASAAEDRR